EWTQVRQVALEVEATLKDFGLIGWPKTSGSRGMHVYVRIQTQWTFDEVRRAALALAREVERRAPKLATSKWWKEERHGVFLDYNQNAKDRTIASAYSVRPTPDARVSAPITWDEVPACNPADFTLATMPQRFADLGDAHAGIDAQAQSLESLLELSAKQESEGFGDAPWPPHYEKKKGEPPRVQPSRRRVSKKPLIEIGRAKHEADALAGLERWKKRHAKAAVHLEPADVLVDRMRGRFTTWTRIRVNLHNVPAELRPSQEPLDPDENTFSSS
ncbi:MAG TPA: DNA primase small subunit domain-containing protein, partial [bacterium]|nr:DNA primase small subunit domain-containing protein [bacterium]